VRAHRGPSTTQGGRHSGKKSGLGPAKRRRRMWCSIRRREKNSWGLKPNATAKLCAGDLGVEEVAHMLREGGVDPATAGKGQIQKCAGGSSRFSAKGDFTIAQVPSHLREEGGGIKHNPMS